MSQDELSFDSYARAIWGAKWAIIIVAIAAAAAASFLTWRRPAQHQASTLIRIGRVWKEPIEDYIVAERIATSVDFLKQAARHAELNPRQLRHAIRVDTLLGGSKRNRYPVLLQVSATTDNEDAARFVEAVARAIIARHDKVFDDAMKPRLEQQHRLEERQKELADQPGSRDLLLKVESELDEVRANNSPANAPVTERTHSIEDPSDELLPRPSILRPAAAAGAVAAVGAALIAALLGHLKAISPRPQTSQSNNAADS